MNPEGDHGAPAEPGTRGSDWSKIGKDGVLSGMIGALLVTALFLAIDLLGPGPLYTPSLLGKVLLRGGEAVNDPAIEPLMVVLYTAVHIVTFIALGTITAWLVRRSGRRPSPWVLLLFLFTILETSFLLFGLAVGGGLIGRLGVLSVIGANLAAAGAMTAVLG